MPLPLVAQMSSNNQKPLAKKVPLFLMNSLAPRFRLFLTLRTSCPSAAALQNLPASPNLSTTADSLRIL